MAITGHIVAVADAICGTHNLFIWSSVILYAIFTGWFGLFIFKK